MRALLLKEFKARWIEYFLGIIIVALVATAVIIQRSLSQAAENEIHGLAHNLGSNMLVVPGEMNMIDFYSFKYGNASMPENYPEIAAGSKAGEHIKMSRPALFVNLAMNGTDVVVVGSDMRIPEASVPDDHLPRALVTEPFAKKFMVEPGSDFMLNGVKVRAVRIIPPDAGIPDYSVIMPLASAQVITGRTGKINALYLGGCWCSIDIPALGKQIESALPGTRAITVAGMVAAQKGILAVMKTYSNVFYLAAMAIVFGTVLILILAQIKKYRREIGLLAAIGATPGMVSSNLYMKAGLVGTAGGLVGFFIGAPIAGFLGREFFGIAASAGIQQLAPVLAVSLASSLMGAFFASSYLVGIDPVETLREV